MSKIIEAAKEAVAIANGEQPAARITINGHTYVPLAVAQHESDCVEAAKAEIESLQADRRTYNAWAEEIKINVRAMNAELDRLRRDCAELYQVIGTMAEHCPDDPAIVKALDNASAAAAGEPRPHDDLLPFVLPSA